jgi:dipeptidyl aminopeptidase/acylaminoacyl peptidase
MCVAYPSPRTSRLVQRLALGLAALITGTSPALGAGPAPLADAASRFGAREAVDLMRLSPDGTQVAYIAPRKGQGSALVVQPATADAKARVVTALSGDPERLGRCSWVSNRRLACNAYGVVESRSGTDRKFDFSRIFAIDADGQKLQLLSTRQNDNAHGVQLGGGRIIDWLPDQEGHVLMTRVYIPEDVVGSRVGSTASGVGVDAIDTSTLRTKRVEPPRDQAFRYISDGEGTVRVIGLATERGASEQLSSVSNFLFRRKGSREWEPLSTFDDATREGFDPVAVDPAQDIAYGFRKLDGRMALAARKLDGSGQETIILKHPEVDVDGLIRIGKRNRVIGASYATDKRVAVYFDEGLAKLRTALSKALPNQQILQIIDTSADEGRLLLWAGSDNDPGVYYLFDRKSGELGTFLVSRPELEGVTLAAVKLVTYPASDGTMVPGYLTLPSGREARNLPAIVLPHGGPEARDEWGFDWLAQYFAHMGYAVLQPNFRGSAGYGEAWLQKNGFRSWRTAIGDVTDAGRWLVKEGIADPSRLGIFGWSYGGYAALQSAVIAPDLFKAVVAVAPVTDLQTLKDDSKGWSNYRLVADFIGGGPHIREGSPAQNAAAIRVPVKLFHGDMDTNVPVRQSRMMADRLAREGRPAELVLFPGLDHYLEDSAARTRLLEDSHRHFEAAFGR